MARDELYDEQLLFSNLFRGSERGRNREKIAIILSYQFENVTGDFDYCFCCSLLISLSPAAANDIPKLSTIEMTKKLCLYFILLLFVTYYTERKNNVSVCVHVHDVYLVANRLWLFIINDMIQSHVAANVRLIDSWLSGAAAVVIVVLVIMRILDCLSIGRIGIYVLLLSMHKSTWVDISDNADWMWDR